MKERKLMRHSGRKNHQNMSRSMPEWSYPWELCSEYHYCILLTHHYLKFRRLNKNHSSDTRSNYHGLSFQPHLWVSDGTRPCKTAEAASVFMAQVFLRNALFPWCDHDQLPLVPLFGLHRLAMKESCLIYFLSIAICKMLTENCCFVGIKSWPPVQNEYVISKLGFCKPILVK